MGCAFSSSGSPLRRPCSGVRVIHTNGYVEDFHGPGVVTVSTVTACLSSSNPTSSSSKLGGGSGYVLCSAAHLLQPGRGAFRPDDALQPGTVYFLLPQSVFHAESSAVDLACLMNRLTALARKGCASSKAPPKPSPLHALFDSAATAAGGGSCQQHRDQPVAVAVAASETAKDKQKEEKEMVVPGRAAPWRPRLDRIDESIGRGSMRSASNRSACSEA